jgi:hypothetical protein
MTKRSKPRAKPKKPAKRPGQKEARIGRPPIPPENVRLGMIRVPVNEGERKRFASGAARAGMPLSVWLRHLAIVECDRQGVATA